LPATTFIGHFLGPDTHSNRPAASGLPNGTLYVCTTHQKIERVVSGAWVDYATLGVGAGSAIVATDPIWDTKGDIVAATAADIATKLPVGTNGQVLTVDSSQPTGLKWATPGASNVAFRSMNFVSDAGATSHVCPMPAGVVAGDVLVMIAHAWGGGTPTLTTPTGWTSRGFHNPGSDVFGCYTRVADGSEGANVTVPASTSTLGNIAILAYSGGSAVDAVTDFGSLQSTATPTVPSVTATAAGVVVGVAAFAGAASATPAAGWTERLDHLSASSGGLIYAMERAQTAAGASPTATPTATGFGGTVWTWAVAIK
jgi:hypothetical protein